MTDAVPDRWAQLRDLPNHPEISVFPDREPRVHHRDVLDAEYTFDCPQCHYNLTGLSSSYCPECGLNMDYEPVEVFCAADQSLVWAAATLLDQHQISNLIVVGNPDPIAGIFSRRENTPKLLAPFKFFHEAANLLDAAFGQRAFKAGERPHQPNAGPDWTCPGCGETNPSSFEVCWDCGHPRADAPTPPPDPPE